MESKKSKPSTNTVTRDLRKFDEETQNIYQSVVIISKRANQIATEVKTELNNKLAEFASSTDNLEEVFENREQIEIARHYEQMPKPTLVSISEYLNDKIYYRVPEND
jgi:DNA-directed RNA polymerase subunit K/omega